MSQLNPRRTIDELKELRAMTGDENGAQRIAFTETWAKARSWLEEKARALGVNRTDLVRLIEEARRSFNPAERALRE